MSTLPARRVSVVVPNYNYGRYLERRIRSILAQTYPIYELIILDDGSTDGSAEKLRELREKLRERFNRGDAKVTCRLQNVTWRIIVNATNSGRAIYQWRKGVMEAKGDYVWIAEADDLARRDFLATAMEGFRDPGVVLSYTESAIINGRGMILAPNFRWSRDKERTGHYAQDYVREGRDEIAEIMAIRCTIPNVSAVVFKKEPDVAKILKEAAKYRQVGDWYFYVKMLEKGKICYNRRALNKFRIHGGSATKEASETGEHFKEVVRAHEYFRKNYKLDARVLEAMEREEVRIRKKHGIME